MYVHIELGFKWYTAGWFCAIAIYRSQNSLLNKGSCHGKCRWPAFLLPLKREKSKTNMTLHASCIMGFPPNRTDETPMDWCDFWRSKNGFKRRGCFASHFGDPISLLMLDYQKHDGFVEKAGNWKPGVTWIHEGFFREFGEGFWRLTIMSLAFLRYLILGRVLVGAEFVPRSECFDRVDQTSRRCCDATIASKWCWDERFTFEKCCQAHRKPSKICRKWVVEAN